MAIRHFEDLVRISPTLRNALAGAEQAARTHSPILILGEPGTGRSTLARTFHHASPRHQGPLAEVDPAAVPSTLFESEFFGYRAGAFTGAETSEEGRIALAEGGTLVLDHIEELPLLVQPKLLGLLAEQRYTPLGGREKTSDLRFIAIGSEDLGLRIQHGLFRPDLYYRLEVLAFRLPPLRDRLGDLPSIAQHLMEDLSDRQRRFTPRLSERALEWMMAYAWPGNLRQLRNVLERALVVLESPVLDPDPPADALAAIPRSLREAEEEAIREALAYTRGHQGQAAELLGISRKALWEKRKRLGIP